MAVPSELTGAEVGVGTGRDSTPITEFGVVSLRLGLDVRPVTHQIIQLEGHGTWVGVKCLKMGTSFGPTGGVVWTRLGNIANGFGAPPSGADQ